MKQRDGELVQLQTELAAAERSRLETQSEVARLAARAQRAEELADEVAQLRTAYTAVEQKHQTMLTVYKTTYSKKYQKMLKSSLLP